MLGVAVVDADREPLSERELAMSGRVDRPSVLTRQSEHGRVLDQIRGRTYRDALIMLEFMPYRSTGPITKVLRSAVANAEHNLGLDPSALVVATASADMGPSMKRYRPRAQGRAFAIKKQTCHISIAVASSSESITTEASN